MFHFGFSYVGLLYLLMLYIPNFIWAKNKPQSYTSEGGNKFLGLLKKIGQVLCTCFALIFTDFNLYNTEWIAWLGASFLLMVLYEV